MRGRFSFDLEGKLEVSIDKNVFDLFKTNKLLKVLECIILSHILF